MKVNSEKERLLCYAGGLFGSMVSNPTLINLYGLDSLRNSAIQQASKLIDLIYDDAALSEVLKNAS